MTWTETQPAPDLQSLGEFVTERLRVMIISGQIPQGAHLAEPQLAKTFDVSRGPVRDALRQLMSEGLVEVHRRKMFSVGLTSRDISELYAIRGSIEGVALQMTHDLNGAQAEWGITAEPMERMRVAAQTSSAEEYAIADLAFHTCFYELSGSRRLRNLWQQYEPTFAVLLKITNAEDIDLGPSLESHERILTLMEQGKIDHAKSELQEHLLGAQIRMTQAHQRIIDQNQGV